MDRPEPGGYHWIPQPERTKAIGFVGVFRRQAQDGMSNMHAHWNAYAEAKKMATFGI